MTTYTVALGKGGVGKSATAAETCLYLAQQGRRVLALDLDRQGNMTTRLGIANKRDLPAVAADVITGDLTPEQAAAPSPLIDGVDVLAGTIDLPDLELRPELMTALPTVLREEPGPWDDVVIDTPSHQGLITVVGLAAADHVIAPVACSDEAWLEVLKLEELIEQKISKPRLKRGQMIHSVIPTLYYTRGTLENQVVARMTKRYGDRVTPTIREARVVKQSFGAARPVGLYAPKSAVAADYRAALDYITTQEN